MPTAEGSQPGDRGRRSLRDLLSPESVVIPLPTELLSDALEALGRGMSGSLEEAEAEPLLEELEELEASTLVPLGSRAILAHLRTDATEEVAIAVGLGERPFAFAPETARGARLLVLVVSPTAGSRAYLQTLGALGRALRREEVAKRILEAGGPEDVLRIPALKEPILGPKLLVRDVMTVDVTCVAPETSLAEVADLMIRRRLRALPVVNDRRDVMGMITDRQVMEHFLRRMGGAEDADDSGAGADAAGAEGVTVRDTMLRSVLCVKEEESLRDVAALMINKDVERYPVCAEGVLVGFLTRGDIIRKLLGPQVWRRRERHRTAGRRRRGGTEPRGPTAGEQERTDRGSTS